MILLLLKLLVIILNLLGGNASLGSRLPCKITTDQLRGILLIVFTVCVSTTWHAPTSLTKCHQHPFSWSMTFIHCHDSFSLPVVGLDYNTGRVMAIPNRSSHNTSIILDWHSLWAKPRVKPKTGLCVTEVNKAAQLGFHVCSLFCEDMVLI